MLTTGSRTKPLLYALAVCLVTGIAAWFAFEVTHAALGTGGGILAAIAAGLLVGGPLSVVGLVIWGPQDPAPPRRPASRSDEELRLR